jgi:hypothetical protein
VPGSCWYGPEGVNRTIPRLSTMKKPISAQAARDRQRSAWP